MSFERSRTSDEWDRKNKFSLDWYEAKKLKKYYFVYKVKSQVDDIIITRNTR